MNPNESWKFEYKQLIQTMEDMGYPEEMGKKIASSLGSETMIHRMRVYLQMVQPESPEEIGDELTALMEEREKWRDQAETREASEYYNRFLYERRPDSDRDDD
ncbi:MAG TPA: hypothetical protein DEP00_00960 [Lachnospiraceae bacterium]|jgi:hypothetical protein|nr:hypothetical protein [Lachnospiraceae bacterium]